MPSTGVFCASGVTCWPEAVLRPHPARMRTASHGSLAPPADQKRYCNSGTRARAVSVGAPQWRSPCPPLPPARAQRGTTGRGSGCGGSVGQGLQGATEQQRGSRCHWNAAAGSRDRTLKMAAEAGMASFHSQDSESRATC